MNDGVDDLVVLLRVVVANGRMVEVESSQGIRRLNLRSKENYVKCLC